MTNAEAVVVLKNMTLNLGRVNGKMALAEALQMAITALQTDGDAISRQAAIDTLDKHLRTTDVPESYPGIISALTEWLNELPPAQLDNSCDGCRYENADDGVLVPCGFCKRSHPDNYERRTDERQT